MSDINEQCDHLGSIDHLNNEIHKIFSEMLPNMHKSRLEAMSVIVATMLREKTVNQMRLAAGLPREGKNDIIRYQYISRFTQNPFVVPKKIMEPFVRQFFETHPKGSTIHLIMDQSQIREEMQLLMLSVYFEKRALPVCFSVHEQEGNVGYEEQEKLLDIALSWIPEGYKVRLDADRFYGSSNLISYANKHLDDYRIRLKSNLSANVDGMLQKTGDLVTGEYAFYSDVRLTKDEVVTNIGVMCEEGYTDPWIIAMKAEPNKTTVRDYSQRWGIEPSFSDMKSRGFDLNKTQMWYTENIERLVMLVALSMYIAVSTGLERVENEPLDHEKPQASPKKAKRSKLSLFQRGLRAITQIAEKGLPLPPLWSVGFDTS